MTEWWQYLLYGVFSVVMGGIVTYFVTTRIASREREATERGQLRTAARSFVVELEANLKLTEGAWNGKLVPFAMDMWEVNKGHVRRLGSNIQDALIGTYVEIQTANFLCRL